MPMPAEDAEEYERIVQESWYEPEKNLTEIT